MRRGFASRPGAYLRPYWGWVRPPGGDGGREITSYLRRHCGIAGYPALLRSEHISAAEMPIVSRRPSGSCGRRAPRLPEQDIDALRRLSESPRIRGAGRRYTGPPILRRRARPGGDAWPFGLRYPATRCISRQGLHLAATSRGGGGGGGVVGAREARNLAVATPLRRYS